MNLRDKNLRTDVLGNIVWDAAKWISAGLIGLALWLLSQLGSEALSTFVSRFEPYKWHFTALFFCLSAFITILLYRRYSKFRPYYPRIDCDFEILELEVIYDHLDKNRMVYTKRKKLRALRNGLDRYFDRYRWTGTGNINIKSSIKSQKVVVEERRSVWQFYAIRFNKKLGRGEEIQTEVVWELKDLENVAVPFLSMTIEEPTSKMILKVKLPSNLHVEEIVKQIAPFMGAKTPFYSITEKIEHNEYTWTIPNPKLLYHYEMEWEWPA
jgi:hypothetical protein